jgi:hypothetical protein
MPPPELLPEELPEELLPEELPPDELPPDELLLDEPPGAEGVVPHATRRANAMVGIRVREVQGIGKSPFVPDNAKGMPSFGARKSEGKGLSA